MALRKKKLPKKLEPGIEFDMPGIVNEMIKRKMEIVSSIINTIVRLSENSTKLQMDCDEMIKLYYPELKEWELDWNTKRKKIRLKRKIDED